MNISYSRRVGARKLLAKEKGCSKLGHFLRGKNKVSYHADYLIFFEWRVGVERTQVANSLTGLRNSWLQLWGKLKMQLDYVLTTTLGTPSKWDHLWPVGFFKTAMEIALKIGIVCSTQCYQTEKSSFACAKPKAKHSSTGLLQRERFIAKHPSKETRVGSNLSPLTEVRVSFLSL